MRSRAVPRAAAGASTLVLGSTAISQAIAPGFVGVSLGYTTFELYAGTDQAAVDPVFERLVRNLAPGQTPVLRFAGTDETWWPVLGLARPPGVTFTLTKGYLRVLRAFAQALDARLILGVNFEADSTAVARTEAQALLSGIGRQWIGAFELGNEPELYRAFAWYRLPDGQGVNGRPPDWSFGDLVADFASISRALPRTVTLAGPAMGSPDWIPLLGAFLTGNPRVGLLTLHEYPLKRCEKSDTVTIAQLLSSAASSGLAQSVAPTIRLAHARGVALRIDEMGAVSCGGMPGVSDSFASALWALNALFALARENVAGVNFQTASYALNRLFGISKVDGRWRAQVNPVYYGAMMFAQAAPAGSRLLSLSGNLGSELNAWATRAPDGSIRVVLVNTATHARTVDLRATGEVSTATATLERLQAPSLRSQTRVTLAGQSFGAFTTTGALIGTPTTSSLTPLAGRYVVSVPGASAALLTLPAAQGSG